MIGLIWQKSFRAMKGPFNLGTFSRLVAFTACSWIACIAVVFCLPTSNPVTEQTVNYTVVAVGIIGIGSIGTWVVWAHRWFTGPAAEVANALRLGVDVGDPGALEKKEKEVQADAGKSAGLEKGTQ